MITALRSIPHDFMCHLVVSSLLLCGETVLKRFTDITQNCDRYYLHVFLEASNSSLCLPLQVVDGYPEVGRSHFRLPTHHQLTQTTVNEHILLLLA